MNVVLFIIYFKVEDQDDIMPLGPQAVPVGTNDLLQADVEDENGRPKKFCFVLKYKEVSTTMLQSCFNDLIKMNLLNHFCFLLGKVINCLKYLFNLNIFY